MGLLINSGVLHPSPATATGIFIFMRFSINFQGKKSPLIIILWWPCLLPRLTVSLVKGTKTAVLQIYYLYQIFFPRRDLSNLSCVFGCHDPNYYPGYFYQGELIL